MIRRNEILELGDSEQRFRQSTDAAHWSRNMWVRLHYRRSNAWESALLQGKVNMLPSPLGDGAVDVAYSACHPLVAYVTCR